MNSRETRRWTGGKKWGVERTKERRRSVRKADRIEFFRLRRIRFSSLSLSLSLDFRSTLRYTRGEGVRNLPMRPPATRNTTRNRCNIGSGCVITLLTPVIAFNPRSSSSRVGWREERRSRKRESSSARWPRSSWSQMGVNLGFSRGCFNFDGSGFGRCCFRGLRACNPSFEREQFGAC